MGEERDVLFVDAARMIVHQQLGSTALLQRRLRIGYSRSQRIMNELEHAGVVGEADGKKLRDVIIANEELLCVLLDIEPDEKKSTTDVLNCPDDIREDGWAVAVHNDYFVDGKFHTVWLFTNSSGKYLKGEGKTDREALDKVRSQL